MKTITLFIGVFIVAACNLFSQTDSLDMRQHNRYSNMKVQKEDDIKTLFGNDIEHGAYIGFNMNYSQVNNDDAIEIGGRVGWIINHVFTIGVEGYGFANNIEVDDELSDNAFELGGGYGGLFFEPILFPKYPVHVSFPVMVGAGGIACTDNVYYYYDDEGIRRKEKEIVESDAYFIVKPGVEVELNMIKYVRLAFGLSYRFTNDVMLNGFDHDILNGFSGGFAVKMGIF